MTSNDPVAARASADKRINDEFVGEEDGRICARAAIRNTGNETARVPDLIKATRKPAAPRHGRRRGSGDNSRPGDQSADHSRPS